MLVIEHTLILILERNIIQNIRCNFLVYSKSDNGFLVCVNIGHYLDLTVFRKRLAYRSYYLRYAV